jgi:hypothetical protein
MIDERLTNIRNGVNAAKTTIANNLQNICRVPASDAETLTALAAKVGLAVPDEWRPDPLWASLDDIADGEIGFIVADRDITGGAGRFAFTVTTSSDNYTIDWGDGITESLDSGTIADHTYAIGGGKPSSDGQTTYKARISAVGTITGISVKPVINNINTKNAILYCNFRAGGVTYLTFAFAYCTSLQSVTFPALPVCTSLSYAFYYCTSLQSVTLPALPACTSLVNAFYYCTSLQSVTIDSAIGSNASSLDFTTAFQRVPATFMALMPSAKFTRLIIFSDDRNIRCGLYALSFSPQSTFSGTAPQIDISRCNMTRAALVDVFNQLPTLSGKQIKITACTGVTDLTAADLQIATAKGWTVITA